MFKERVKDFAKKFNESIQRKDIDIYSITKEYYELLKETIDEEKLNKMIINRINKDLLPKEFEIEEIFNKSKELKKEDLEKTFLKLNDTIIDSLNENNPQKLYNFEIEETKTIIQEEIMNWDFFKQYFDSKVDYWKIKEAIGWIAAYVETEDYDPEKILQYDNGILNKKQTLKNILVDINKKSLTENKPFLTQYNENNLNEDGEFRFNFNPAKSGEIDVMLWSEKKQKAVASSVTRDRSVDIEGNQFIRHYMKMLAMTLDTKRNQSRRNKGDETLTRLEYKRYIKSNDYKSLSNKIRAEKNISEDLKKEIKEKVVGNNGEIKFVRNDFLKDLIIVRLNIRSQTGKDFLNKKNISEEEMKEILKIGKDNIEYNYFGEILKSQSKELNKVLAGFNSFAYTNNYIDIGNINVGLKNAVEFLKELKFNYNADVGNNSFIDGMNNSIIALTINSENFSAIADGLSRGKSFNEERVNFYRSMQTVLRILNESEDKILTMKELFNINNNQAESFINKIKSEDFVEELKKKFEMIKINQSETTIDRDSTIMMAENLSLKIQKEELLKDKEILELLRKKQGQKKSSCQKIN
tara:strand:- start:25482 stop:27227 length:1746 start_codon:yes stop_codon:yes gene_type:complete